MPRIVNSAAFRADGLLIITFDESGGLNGRGLGGLLRRAARCTGRKYAPGLSGPGGGRIGAVVLSPFVKPGTVSDEPYNHYALLRHDRGALRPAAPRLRGRAGPEDLRRGRLQRRLSRDGLTRRAARAARRAG